MQYVVLQIDSNDVSNRFVEDMLRAPEGGMPFVPQTARIVGQFQGPTNFCDPSDGHRGRKTDAGWTRGKKYGWWVCGSCKKPTRAWGKNLNAVLSSARNLLVENHILGAAPASTPSDSNPTTATTTTGQTT